MYTVLSAPILMYTYYSVIVTKSTWMVSGKLDASVFNQFLAAVLDWTSPLQLC